MDKIGIPCFVVFVLVAAASIPVVAFTSANSFSGREGILTDVKEWPRPLAQHFHDLGLPRGAIQVYGKRFIDQHSVTRIEGHSSFVLDFIGTQRLEKTDATHAFFEDLQQATPADWVDTIDSDAKWYATPGFRSESVAGRVYFLVCMDTERGVSLILHRNIF